MSVLLGIMGCSVTREAVKSDVRSQWSEVRVDSVKEEVVVAVHDTIMEVTTIHVRTNETGDTVRITTVTDRDRVRDKSRADRATRKNVIRTDTVFIEKRDSVLVKNTNVKGRDSPVVMALRWICAIIIGLCIVFIIKT